MPPGFFDKKFSTFSTFCGVENFLRNFLKIGKNRFCKESAETENQACPRLPLLEF